MSDFFKFCTGTCIVNGRTYRSGEKFVSSDCLSKCTCHPGGNIFCIPLCLSQGNACKLDEQAVQTQENVPNTTCTCSVLKCVKNNQTISVVGHVISPSTQGILDSICHI